MVSALEAVARSRAAFESWGRLGAAERVPYLAALRRVMLADLDRIVERIVAETGKVPVDALTGDLMTTLDLLSYLEAQVTTVLASEERPGHPLFVGSRFRVEYHPLGAVVVLAPWNYPLQLSLIPALTALAAGNTVVLKPSEVTPSVGELIANLAQRAGLPKDVLQVVSGGPEVGAALVQARPDKIFFTGSVATGRRVGAAAAELLIPIELELGGKDPMIVFADAHFERAVGAAVYGAFVNAGQVCVGIERVYVERPLYGRFVEAVTQAAQALRVGSSVDDDVGAIIDPRQRAVIDAHVDDALARGAKATTRVTREGALYHPVVLEGVDHSMKVMTEETFGPILPVMPFDGEDEAVRLANDSIYGLNAAVFSADLPKAERVARRLVVGSCAINDVLKNIGNPHMPFGGVKASGHGRYHGPEGLRTFSRSLSLTLNGGQLPREVNWFPYGARVYQTVASLLRAAHGGASKAPATEAPAGARGLFRGLFGKPRS